MNKFLLPLLAILLLANFDALSQCNCNFIITPSSPYVWDGVKMGVKPGDKICFANGTRGDIMLMNIKGTAAQPVTISNMCDGKVIIKGNTGTGRLLYMGTNSYVRVTGSANPNEQYGIELTTGVQGIDFRDLSTNVEVDHLYIHDLGYSAINAKTDPTCDSKTWRGNFTMYDVKVHDNWVKNTGGEAIYIGESHYNSTVTATPCNLQVQEHDVIGVQVYNNKLENIGRDGIQVGAATSGSYIHHNTIYNFGTTHEGYDASGIQINPGTNAEIYDNVIDNGFGFGIFGGGRGGSHIYNNTISNCVTGGIILATYQPVDVSGFIVANNTLVNNQNLGIQVYSSLVNRNLFINNIIVAPATGTFKYVDVDLRLIKWTESNNLKTNDINSVKFVNAGIKDFHLQSTSPAKDVGTNASSYGIPAVDFDGKARPSGTAYDLGAFELQSGSNANPVANAGADKSITLPTNSVSITGTGTDSDGTIASYAWTKIAGGNATLTNANTATLTASALVAGSYTFRLTVTDNKGATASDDMIVTVSASNVAPVANAGADKSITLPTNSISLTGSGTDSDGTISSYTWMKLVGGNATLTNGGTSTLTVSGLVAGSYTFRLTVTDNKGATSYDDVVVTVNAASSNAAPVANAGADKSITLPTNSISLTGSGTDSDGTIASYTWMKLTGGSATLTNGGTSTLTVSGLVAGSYTFRLTVTDNKGATAYDDVAVTVAAAAASPTPAPTANGGGNKTLTMPANSVTLAGSATGSITSYSWTKVSGGSATMANQNTASLSLTDLNTGSYVFRLTVTDNAGRTASDDVTVTENPVVTGVPVANAGIDKNITLPTNSITLYGTASGSASIPYFEWAKVSGGAVTFINQYTPTVTLSNLVAGTYVFQLKVTDSAGKVATDQVTVIVNSSSSNASPVAYAGADVQIKLPSNSLTIYGSGTDSNGTVSSYLWTKLSGGSVTMSGQYSATLSLSALVEGTYVFRLNVTDNAGATSYDDVTVVVKAVNEAPVANAGSDQSITLPTNSLVLTGTATDADGTVPYYEWQKISGGSVTFANQYTSRVTLSGLVQGIYVFRLKVTDNLGKVGTDDITVTVNGSAARMAAPESTTFAEINEESIPFTFLDHTYTGGTSYAVKILDMTGSEIYTGEWDATMYDQVFAKGGLHYFWIYRDGKKIDEGKVVIVR